MQKDFLEKLKTLLRDVWGAEPDFYRAEFTAAGIDERFIEELDEEKFKLLPAAAKKELAAAPYRSRLYREKSGLNKLVSCSEAERHFLVHRTLEEIREDDLPLDGARPLVLLSDVYEAIERCLFFYEHNILPLIGEFHNSVVVTATARQYKVDNIFIDHASILNFRKGLLELGLPVRGVTVIDSSFLDGDMDWPEEIKRHFILSFPETGRIAYLCPEAVGTKRAILHPYPDIHVEPGALSVITSVRLRACPVIRYQIPLYLESVSNDCPCAKASFVF